MEGRELLHMLAMRPATAQFISRKLAMRFVSDDPPQALVDRMAKSYLASGGDIPTVLTTLFHSPEFWAAGDYRAKVKTPLEFVVSAARASNANIENYQPLVNALRQMGMPLYGCIPPVGYKWDAARLGEHWRARGPHEFCSVAGRQPASRHYRGVGAGDGYERAGRRCARPAGDSHAGDRRGAAGARCCCRAG